jgi:hypothetical protein
METALKRHKEGTLQTIPIILEPCDWKSSPLGKLKVLPKDGKPISIWTNENVAYLDVVTELRRLTEIPGNKSQGNQAKPQDQKFDDVGGQARRYRIKKEFDSIDRDEFRQKSFGAIQEYFRHSIDELSEIGDPIRARFERISDVAFSCTVLNKGNRNKEAHITIRSGDDAHFGNSITYSYARHSDSINGLISIEANEFELYLKSDGFGIQRARDNEPMSAEQAADALWRELISHAGIEHG